MSLLLSHWYPGSGVVLDWIVSWSLPSFLLCISQSPILFDSLRWRSGYLGEKRLNCKNYHFQELCFSKVSNVRSTSASFGKPHLSLSLTNQCLTIMARSGTVIYIAPLWWHCPCADPEGDRGSGHPPENNKYVHWFLKKLAFGPPPLQKVWHPKPPGKLWTPSGSLVKYKYSFLSNKTIGPPL